MEVKGNSVSSLDSSEGCDALGVACDSAGELPAVIPFVVVVPNVVAGLSFVVDFPHLLRQNALVSTFATSRF